MVYGERDRHLRDTVMRYRNGLSGSWIGLLSVVFALWGWLSCAGAAVALQEVASGLNQPVAVAHAGDGSGRLFVTLQGGQVVIFDGERVLPRPFLDLRDRVGRRCFVRRSASHHRRASNSGRRIRVPHARDDVRHRARHPSRATRLCQRHLGRRRGDRVCSWPALGRTLDRPAQLARHLLG